MKFIIKINPFYILLEDSLVHDSIQNAHYLHYSQLAFLFQNLLIALLFQLGVWLLTVLICYFFTSSARFLYFTSIGSINFVYE